MDARPVENRSDVLSHRVAGGITLLLPLLALFTQAHASLGPIDPGSTQEGGTPQLNAGSTASESTPERTASEPSAVETIEDSERSELFQRISQRKLEFERDVLQAPQAAAPLRADEPTDAAAATPPDAEPLQKEQGARPLDRRPAIDPASSLEGSAEPQL